MSARITCLHNRVEITQRLQTQSLRFEQAVAALRAISDLANMVKAAHGAGFRGCDELDVDSLAGLAATLAQGIERPLIELDQTIGQLKRGHN